MQHNKDKSWTLMTVRISMLSLVMIFTQSIFADDLKIGSAAVKITPPEGTPLAGYYTISREAIGVHDDLFAKAIVIEKDRSKIAIVTCDLVAISTEIVSKVRDIVENTVGIPSDHVMVSATHSHTGPVIPKKNSMYNITGKTAEIHNKYISELPGLIAESVKLANSALISARISIGKGHEESISFNRRFFMTDGTVGWNPGKLNPKIIKPAGPIDPDVLILYAETSDGKPLATYVNFAIHLDNVGGVEISADMPYTLSTILGKIKGDGMVTLFAQGCSGNINQNNVKTKETQKSHTEAKRLGTVLAGEVIKTYTKLDPVEADFISVKKEIVKLPLPEIKPEELSIAQEVISRVGKPNAPKFLELVNAYKVIDVIGRIGEPIDAEIQIIALGDECAIVGLPGEIFTELGMYLKSRSLFSYTIVVELTNGNFGYIPDRKAFIEGNYEPVSSRCAPGSGEILVEKAIQLLNELKMKKL